MVVCEELNDNTIVCRLKKKRNLADRGKQNLKRILVADKNGMLLS